MALAITITLDEELPDAALAYVKGGTGLLLFAGMPIGGEQFRRIFPSDLLTKRTLQERSRELLTIRSSVRSNTSGQKHQMRRSLMRLCARTTMVSTRHSRITKLPARTGFSLVKASRFETTSDVLKSIISQS